MDLVVMALPHFAGWRPPGGIMPLWPPIMPPPIEPIIAIMLVIASGARGDCMNSCIAFFPSSVTPAPCIISEHVAIASAGLSVGFVAAIAAVASSKSAEIPTSMRVITLLIGIPPSRRQPSRDTGPRTEGTSRYRFSSRSAERDGGQLAGGERGPSGQTDRLLGVATIGPTGIVWRGSGSTPVAAEGTAASGP